jgi:hypothetical protein
MAAVCLCTRKPVDQLTLGDFAAFPVWEYANDEQGAEGRDETWVRPVDTTVVPKRSYPCEKLFVIRARNKDRRAANRCAVGHRCGTSAGILRIRHPAQQHSAYTLDKYTQDHYTQNYWF